MLNGGLGITPAFAFNDAGQAAFWAELIGAGVDASNNQSIWSEGAGDLHLVAQREHAPGAADGVNFAALAQGGEVLPALNTAGQTAFVANLSDGGAGIWATDRTGVLKLIVQTGGSLEVAPGDSRTIYSLGFRTGDMYHTTFDSGLNDLGQVAFLTRFTDGTSGIFVSSAVAVPEPTASVLIGITLFVSFIRFRTHA